MFEQAPCSRTEDRISCLHIACQEEHLEIVKTLIEAGGEALLLKTAKDGSSCLHIACQEGHLEIAKALIKAGGEALLLKTTEDGSSCLHIACQEGHLEISQAGAGDSRAAFLHMTQNVSGSSCLHAPCRLGRAAIVDFLLSQSCAGLIGLRDRSGRTALDIAVAAGQTAAAEAIRAASGRPALGGPDDPGREEGRS